jgi:hypothetical protein
MPSVLQAAAIGDAALVRDHLAIAPACVGMREEGRRVLTPGPVPAIIMLTLPPHLQRAHASAQVRPQRPSRPLQNARGGRGSRGSYRREEHVCPRVPCVFGGN